MKYTFKIAIVALALLTAPVVFGAQVGTPENSGTASVAAAAAAFAVSDDQTAANLFAAASDRRVSSTPYTPAADVSLSFFDQSSLTVDRAKIIACIQEAGRRISNRLDILNPAKLATCLEAFVKTEDELTYAINYLAYHNPTGYEASMRKCCLHLQKIIRLGNEWSLDYEDAFKILEANPVLNLENKDEVQGALDLFQYNRYPYKQNAHQFPDTTGLNSSHGNVKGWKGHFSNYWYLYIGGAAVAGALAGALITYLVNQKKVASSDSPKRPTVTVL